MDVSNFDKLKFALSAYNDANRQSNRMWSAAALLAVFVFTARYSSEDRSILGISLQSEFVLPAAIIVLSGLNIAYSVAHVRISELPDSDFANSRTAISVIPGQFGHGWLSTCCHVSV